ncbi:prepilin peptidase [Erwinia sorbitola]|uniref:Prepilin leader peptidase/N-methyltransferase n=1 Tax=Erwinia sorbitola TaxID=2681984 RepID=A0A6I6EK21_9GAMM|nr:A24 family peptidase [Erwinia sorbitola]MTD27379.1 prepilin peptidase [Erwinia sorbitola]QGU88918.1 prepilin peptidase [Erwinia sorbitola]
MNGYYFFLLALLGISVGSLLNVVTYRLPLMISNNALPAFNLWLPASHCTQCKKSVRWYDNLPLLSWWILKGRCRYCHLRISCRYPLTELSSLLLTLLCALLFPPGKLLLVLLPFSWLLLALILIDADCQLLPDILTLPLLWLGLLANTVGWLPQLPLPEAVTGAMLGYCGLALLSHGYRALTGKNALGLGDAKLLAALGAWLGWQLIPQLLLAASLGGICWVILGRLLYRRSISAPLAFGPFLAVAGWVLMVVQYR